EPGERHPQPITPRHARAGVRDEPAADHRLEDRVGRALRDADRPGEIGERQAVRAGSRDRLEQLERALDALHAVALLLRRRDRLFCHDERWSMCRTYAAEDGLSSTLTSNEGRESVLTSKRCSALPNHSAA